MTHRLRSDLLWPAAKNPTECNIRHTVLKKVYILGEHTTLIDAWSVGHGRG